MKIVNNTWGDGKGSYTCLDEMYFEYIAKYFVDFNYGNVLEIGPGTGRFGLMMMESYDIESYSVLDLRDNINDSIEFLDKNGIKVNAFVAEEYDRVLEEKFDFIVSNVCIPETPKEYREKVLGTLIPSSQGAMIIGQLNGHWVDGDEYESWIMDLFNQNFDHVFCEKTTYKNCYVLTGIKNE